MASPGPVDRVLLGRVIGLWGVQGWVRIYSDTRPPDAIFSYKPWFLGTKKSAVHIKDWRRQGRKLMVQLDGFTDADQAAKLIDLDIQADRKALPEPEQGAYYWSDLIGLAVINLQGHCYGKVHRLIETGANDVLDVRDESDRSTLLPFVQDEFVREVDLAAGQIMVDWPVEWTKD